MPQPVHLKARVAEIIDHAPGLRTLHLDTGRRVPRFKPGQFLHLALDPYDPAEHWPDSRCFSIASAPEQRKRLRLTISAVGAFTRRMMELALGDEVWLKLPYGDFVIEAGGQGAASEVVIVAGGTGLAPFMSLLGSERVMPQRLRLLYGARRPELLIYADDLDQAAGRWPDFMWQAVLEQGAREGAVQGRLSAELALAQAHNAQSCRFYLSGPPAMIEALRKGLVQHGVAGEMILVDAWD